MRVLSTDWHKTSVQKLYQIQCFLVLSTASVNTEGSLPLPTHGQHKPGKKNVMTQRSNLYYPEILSSHGKCNIIFAIYPTCEKPSRMTKMNKMANPNFHKFWNLMNNSRHLEKYQRTWRTYLLIPSTCLKKKKKSTTEKKVKWGPFERPGF